jgi:head-tail adaptor
VGEGIAGQQLRGRFHPGITLETRVRFGARTFQVQSVTDVDEQQIEVILLCAEVVGRHGGE